MSRRSNEADRLYGLPLDEFVRERDALARTLRKDGRRAEADEVASLAKPSVAAWAVNQVARGRPGDLRALLDAAERLRQAQTGGGENFAQAAAAERDAVRSLTEVAGNALREAGRPPSAATLDKIARTLHAGVADDDARRDLERGTLVRDLEPAGFGSLLGAMPAAPARKRKPAGDGKVKARKALEEAQARAREAHRAAADAQSALERARRDAAEAQRRADAAHQKVEEAENRLRNL